MKKLFTITCSLFAATAALAAVIELVPGSAAIAPGGKLAHIEAVSTVAAGTVSVVSEVRIETNAVETVELAPVTNTTYRLVYKDGAATVTNVTDRPVDFTYIGTNYVSYATNTVVTTGHVTNSVMKLALAATNTVDTLTCSSGIGAKSPSDKWLAPGAKVWFTGTAKGRVFLYIER
ncbi:MAG: hypothetical protein IKE55_01380 [Kiritimatiellae bacterium]|nr:hypothetical protein [Kiritimatiellia bacterium]